MVKKKFLANQNFSGNVCFPLATWKLSYDAPLAAAGEKPEGLSPGSLLPISPEVRRELTYSLSRNPPAASPVCALSPISHSLFSVRQWNKLFSTIWSSKSRRTVSHFGISHATCYKVLSPAALAPALIPRWFIHFKIPAFLPLLEMSGAPCHHIISSLIPSLKTYFLKGGCFTQRQKRLSECELITVCGGKKLKTDDWWDFLEIFFLWFLRKLAKCIQGQWWLMYVISLVWKTVVGNHHPK